MTEVSAELDRGFDYDYELRIWVQSQKPFTEFEDSVRKIVAPLKLENSKFELGAIVCRITDVEAGPPAFEGVPNDEYQYLITVDTHGGLIWGYFSRQFALALALGIRTKFLSTYLITNDADVFVVYSGSHKPLYLNPNYESWKNGEFGQFRVTDAIEVGT